MMAAHHHRGDVLRGLTSGRNWLMVAGLWAFIFIVALVTP